MPKETGLPTQLELAKAEKLPQAYPPKPEAFTGSEPEWAVYWALTALGVPFEYQSSLFGGRSGPGGAVADFTLPDYRLLIRVQGSYWHYASSQQVAYDELQKAMMVSAGWTVVDIDEQDALRAPLYYVREALSGIDHSLGATM